MAELKQFFPSVQPWASGCPDPVVLNAIRESVRLICDEVPVWRVDNTLALIGGITDYEIEVPAGSELVTVESLRQRDSKDLMNLWHLKGNNLVIPVDYTGSKVVLTELVLIVRPSMTATEIPDECLTAISHVAPYGARWQLLDIPGQKWSDPLNAEKNRQLFYQKLSALRGEVMHKGNRHRLQRAADPLA
ncbi:hypothetical protein NX722_28400 [Endozoicomonas gorgoniicola]|uniref:Uncharacterized protein n=1 Tax=Endozoicomonas gorgoniicola TaxID=1234144 RepID=A0ABT3N4D9_9GAMM|nr:hypothetical protein [Endozoicomonas gorgoniicola]MCW7556488.1 hypothetical protein [Endozoicomonas gorgoniicola]